MTDDVRELVNRLGQYPLKRFPFMRHPGEFMPVTEPYVSIPPALVIRDREQNLWTFGFARGTSRTGEFEYDVVRNGVTTNEFACRIEYRNGRVRIYGADRWRIWTGTRFI
jgi:hypothetical protein